MQNVCKTQAHTQTMMLKSAYLTHPTDGQAVFKTDFCYDIIQKVPTFQSLDQIYTAPKISLRRPKIPGLSRTFAWVFFNVSNYFV